MNIVTTSNHTYHMAKLSLAVIIICISSNLVNAQKNGGKANTIADKTDPSSEPFVNWAKSHAFPLMNSDSATDYNDLLPLKKIIGNARIVALGEPAHGFHEPMAFRNRLFRYLVENYGFTTIVLEAGLAESRAAAEFIATGKGTAQSSAGNLSIERPSAENIELLEWMRKYNADPAHKLKVKVYGMDMQLRGYPGDTTPSHAALDEALAYLKNVDPGSAAAIISKLSPYINRLSVAKYPLLSAQEHDKVSTALDELISIFERQRMQLIAKSSKVRYDWAYRNAIVARQTDKMVRVSPADEPGKIPPKAWMTMNARDASMAENVIWILNNQPDKEKIFVYAHNAHVKNAPTAGGVWDAFEQAPNSAGEYLKSKLGNEMCIIGTSFVFSGIQAQQGSLDAALLKVNIPRFVLDVREATKIPAVAAWLSLSRPMSANSVTYMTLPAGTAFDAILFISKNTTAK